MRKGFIGPIGDDLPSLLIIVLAMGLFFSSIIFVFNSYNDKVAKLRMAEGSIEAARAAAGTGIFDNSSVYDAVQKIAASYGLAAHYGIDEKCSTGEYALTYFVANMSYGPAKLVLCTHAA